MISPHQAYVTSHDFRNNVLALGVFHLSCICELGVLILPLFCDFDIWFWNCSDSVVFIIFLFTSLCFYSFSLFTDACILFVFCEVLILKKQKRQIYQPLCYIARLIDLNIQVPTRHRFMGKDENNFNGK